MKTNAKPIIMTTLMMFMIFFMNVQEGTAQTQEVHQEVDVMPQPPGGMSGLMAFMSENLKYPEQAKEKGVEGVVIVSFVVQKDGSISNPEILRGIGAGCDEEAIRVVKAFPSWTPGEKDGEKVNTQIQLPVKYML
ncbi:energy transducer TonB [Algoriphagus halophilus]|uniref:TonB family C-terminal domain-containing protein n=1 Tax=Algoriphagus halophilus TaxID=226505 RepID=A0A1N6DK04_9BACT|nr:energy transducer TonB [Algoriphagus halophilus]SIN71098.1 TonB family C-terminal domain-containing protein [Algoriphagus halophilus]